MFIQNIFLGKILIYICISDGLGFESNDLLCLLVSFLIKRNINIIVSRRLTKYFCQS